MRNMVIILLIAGSWIAQELRAQVVYESSSGTSSITLRDTGALGINFADASIEVGYVRRVSTNNWRLGASAEVEASEGFAELFSDSKFSSPELSGSLFGGYVWESEKPDPTKVFLYSLLGAQFTYERGTLALAEKNAQDVLSIREQKFEGLTAGVFYNTFLRKFIFPEETLVGIGVRYGRRNNFEDLKKVEICEEVTSGTSAEGSPTVARTCENARFGEYETSSELSADLDIIWYQRWAKNRLALSLLGRYNSPDEEDKFIPGFGIFVTEDGKPMKFLGGLTAEHVENDWRIGLQIGFPFS